MDNNLLQESIQLRYSKEAENCSNLSCGTNMYYLDLKEDGILLDIGCGKGKDTIYAAKQMPKGLAIGLDITDTMLEKAKENALNTNVFNVSFIKGDLENLPFKNEVFDYVISNCVLNHAKDKKKAYSEIWRVLKKGGYFVISDPVTKYPLPDNIKNNPNEWADCFGGAITEEEYLQSIKEAGFSKVNILNRREYLKKGYDFISLTIKAWR